MEGSKLYVGNLSYGITNDELKEAFAPFGEVKQVNVIEGKGFGFVEMATPEEAEKAKEGLNGKEIKGRTMKVDEARPPKARPRRDFGGGGGGGRGRY
jgi:RNA recognition motif-containing protein